VDLRVPAGSTLALVGESGSGKSSIVQLACRFYDPDQGAVRTAASATPPRLRSPAPPAEQLTIMHAPSTCTSATLCFAPCTRNVLAHLPRCQHIQYVILRFQTRRSPTSAFTRSEAAQAGTRLRALCSRQSTARVQVLLDGRDLRTLSLPWFRARVGLVSQEPTLFGTTVARNIAALTDASDAAIMAAAQAANAHGFIMALPLKCACSLTPACSSLAVESERDGSEVA